MRPSPFFILPKHQPQEDSPAFQGRDQGRIARILFLGKIRGRQSGPVREQQTQGDLLLPRKVVFRQFPGFKINVNVLIQVKDSFLVRNYR